MNDDQKLMFTYWIIMDDVDYDWNHWLFNYIVLWLIVNTLNCCECMMKKRPRGRVGSCLFPVCVDLNQHQPTQSDE